MTGRSLEDLLNAMPPGVRLGSLCPSEHRFMDSEFSLRYPNGNCIECAKTYVRLYKLRKRLYRLTHGENPLIQNRYQVKLTAEMLEEEINRILSERPKSNKPPRDRKKKDLVWGKPCQNGHADPIRNQCLRGAISGECEECRLDRARRLAPERNKRRREKRAAERLAMGLPVRTRKAQASTAGELASQSSVKRAGIVDYERVKAEYIETQRELKRLEVMERRMAR